jgi:hypothetical protein
MEFPKLETAVFISNFRYDEELKHLGHKPQN